MKGAIILFGFFLFSVSQLFGFRESNVSSSARYNSTFTLNQKVWTTKTSSGNQFVIQGSGYTWTRCGDVPNKRYNAELSIVSAVSSQIKFAYGSSDVSMLDARVRAIWYYMMANGGGMGIISNYSYPVITNWKWAYSSLNPKFVVANDNSLTIQNSPNLQYTVANSNGIFMGSQQFYLNIKVDVGNGTTTRVHWLKFSDVWTNGPADEPPVVDISAVTSTTVDVGGSVRFTSNASDANDDLAYHNLDILNNATGIYNYSAGFSGATITDGPQSIAVSGGSSARDNTVRFDEAGTYTLRFTALDAASTGGWQSSAIINVTVNTVVPPPVNGITYLSLGLPATGDVGEVIQFNARITNSGTKNYGASHGMSLRREGDPTVLWGASLSGINAGQTADIPFTLTLPSTQGTYVYEFEAFESGVESFGGTQTGSIVVMRQPFTVTVTIVGDGSVTGAGSYFEGDNCTLVPVPASQSYFAGFSGDQIGAGATSLNPAPSITFLVDRDMSITASFAGKAVQIVTLDNPGTKPSNAPPFLLRWTTNAGTDPTGFIVSGPAIIDTTELVTLNGTEGPVNVRLDFPANTFYLAASVETSFLVGPPVAGTVLDATSASTMLTAAYATQSLSGNDVLTDTVGAFVNSSEVARDTIALSRLQVAGLYDPNAPIGGGDTGGGSDDIPTVTTLPATGSIGDQVIYQGHIYEYMYAYNKFGWFKK